MSDITQGDIILVPFPYTDLNAQRSRPALVVSRENSGDELVIAVITSKKSDNSVVITPADLREGQLPITSFVRYDKLVTLAKSLAGKTVGALSEAKRGEVVGKVRELF